MTFTAYVVKKKQQLTKLVIENSCYDDGNQEDGGVVVAQAMQVTKIVISFQKKEKNS